MQAGCRLKLTTAIDTVITRSIFEQVLDLLIFDCDGVLVDSELISCASVADVMTRHGVPTDLEYVMRRFLGRPASAITQDYMERAAGELPATFISDWRSSLFAQLRSELSTIDGIAYAIEAIPLPRCVASSSDMERLEISLSKTGLFDLFEGNLFSTTMVRNGKPAPDLFLLAADRMGADPTRCLVVEDSESGIRAAKAAGMKAVGFTGGSHYGVLDNTSALRDAGADHILTKMAGLPALLGYER